MIKGTVVKSTGYWYKVQNSEGIIFNCRLRGKFKIQNIKLTNPIASGDKVQFKRDDLDSESYIIEKILKRENYIIRKSNKKKSSGHIIASNVDLALLVCSVRKPITKYNFIENFLITSNAYDIPSCLVFNKKDLINKDEEKELMTAAKQYNKIGYKTLIISAKYNNGINEVKKLLDNKTCLFMGNSGVGKSTLINKLCKNSNQKTSVISKRSKKGKHTTTFSEIFYIDDKTSIIDTPGIKEFELFDIKKEELKDYYPEFISLNKSCKYYNCLHINEPDCEVINNIGKTIWIKRYNNYLSIIENL